MQECAAKVGAKRSMLIGDARVKSVARWPTLHKAQLHAQNLQLSLFGNIFTNDCPIQ
jgi:hypothetical protein